MSDPITETMIRNMTVPEIARHIESTGHALPASLALTLIDRISDAASDSDEVECLECEIADLESHVRALENENLRLVRKIAIFNQENADHE